MYYLFNYGDNQPMKNSIQYQRPPQTITRLISLTILISISSFLSNPVHGDVISQPNHTIQAAGWLRSLEFSPDGKYLFFATTSSVNLYELKENKFIFQSKDYSRINSASLSPNQRQFAVVGKKGVKIVDIQDGSYFSLREEEMGTCRYSADGERLFLGTLESPGAVLAYDPYTWNQTIISKVLEFAPFSIEPSPDQTKIAFVANHPNSFSPDAKSLSSIPLYDIQSYKLIRTLDGNLRETCAVAYTPDGRFLISGGRDGFLRIWDLETGNQIRNYPIEKIVWSLAVTPNNQYIVAGEESNTIQIIDFYSGEHKRTLQYTKIKGVVGIDVEISPDGNYVATGAFEDNTVDLWDIRDLNTSSETPVETPSVTPTPSRTPVPTPTNTPTMQTAERIYTLGKNGDKDDPGIMYAVAFSPDNQRIYTADYQKRIIAWNKKTAEILHIFQSDIEFPSKLQLTQNGNHVWLGGQHQGGYKIVGWDTDTGDEIYSKKWEYIFYAWEVTPDESSILYGSWNDGAILINKNSDNILGHYIAQENIRKIENLQLSPQGDRALIAEWNQESFPNYTQATIWDLKTGKAIRSFPYDNRRIDRVFWSQDERYVYLNSWANRPDGDLDNYYLDQYVVSTGEHLFRQIISSDNRIALSPDGTRILKIRYQEGAARPRICYVDNRLLHRGNSKKLPSPAIHQYNGIFARRRRNSYGFE
jgi:WD40 repeat protein